VPGTRPPLPAHGTFSRGKSSGGVGGSGGSSSAGGGNLHEDAPTPHLPSPTLRGGMIREDSNESCVSVVGSCEGVDPVEVALRLTQIKRGRSPRGGGDSGGGGGGDSDSVSVGSVTSLESMPTHDAADLRQVTVVANTLDTQVNHET